MCTVFYLLLILLSTTTFAAQEAPQEQPEKLSSTINLVNKNNEIRIGSTMPLTGGVSTIGKDFTYGLNMVFNAFNKRGGASGKLIRLYSLDDHYSSTSGIDNIRSLRTKTPLMMGVFSAKALEVLLPDLTSGNIAMLFGLSGISSIHSATLPYVINFRPSLSREVEALVKYIITEKHIDKIAVLYEDSPWGSDGVAAAERYVQENGLKLCAKASYPQNTVNVGPAIQSIAQANPTAIICIAQSRPSYNFIQGILGQGQQHCRFLGVSEVAPIQYLFKKSRGIDVAVSMSVPDPFKSNLPVVANYRRDMQNYLPYVELSPFSLEGYFVASLLVNTLQRLKGEVTLGALMQSFETIKNQQFGGIQLNFDPTTRTLSSAIWIKESSDREARLFLK